VHVQDVVVQDIHHVRKQNARIQLQNSYTYATRKDDRERREKCRGGDGPKKSRRGGKEGVRANGLVVQKEYC